MSSVNGLVNTFLSEYSGLTALVPAERVLTQQGHQDTAKPYVVHFIVSDIHEYTLTGRNGCRSIRLQVSCFGSSLASAEAVADQVIAGLEAWAESPARVGPVLIQNVFNLSEEDPDLYHVAVEATIKYQGE